jgi:dipeptidase
MVESTCGATPALLSLARTNPSQGARDGALWDISALSRVALSRCPSARCAVDLMGYLATRDGFYGGHGTGLPEVAANGELLLVSAAC